MLASESLKKVSAYLHRASTPPSTRTKRPSTHRKAKQLAHDLFTRTYSDTYFGLSQCIAIDAIVFAVHSQLKEALISRDQGNWLLLALAKAMMTVSNTTGHFAQYLEPSKHTLKRFIRQRKRTVWHEWLAAISMLSPVGERKWRAKNRVYNQDCIHLLKSLRTRKIKPSVIYADPPYTDDQYSRYYHILETLIKYDHPTVTGKGRYRPDRFQTPFSQRGGTASAFNDLVRHSAALKADLVVSYPTNGLLQEVGVDPLQILRQHYPRVVIAYETPHQHSTFGASKGDASAAVIERVYQAQPK